ncbi:MAG TPA: zinc ribbon domain-containing protein [Chloroflexi bacterium]|jgi:putative FmdB family regulatory protein|nr:zinc ribbon domain-containing protein [Chloroflexota bacterium]HPO58079.1 zinc ribbon domain-containing protein [Anaerolineaceae bacterium]
MPVYTYRCQNCGVQFDRTQKFSDEPLRWCPECGKESLRKVYTPVGIIFKGSGFYATDNRSPSGAGRTTDKEHKSTTTETTASAAKETPAASTSTGSSSSSTTASSDKS